MKLSKERVDRELRAVMTRMRADKIPAGNSKYWRIEKFEVSEIASFLSSLRQYQSRGVPPGEYTRLLYNADGKWDVMMSDTPAELNDALPFVQRAKGHVLVTGLGLGCVVRGLSKKNDVQSITVVEISRELVEMVWPSFKRFPKVRLVGADANTWVPPADMHFDSAWHDIWPTISDLNIPEMDALRKRYPTTVLTMCWAETNCRRMAYVIEAMKKGELIGEDQLETVVRG